jgi:hypothetical protein
MGTETGTRLALPYAYGRNRDAMNPHEYPLASRAAWLAFCGLSADGTLGFLLRV